MDATTVFRVLDLVPDRTPRAASGLAFAATAASCLQPDRLALLGEFLHWLSPLYPTTKDDQTRFGLFAARHVAEEDETAEIEEETLV
jgi:hypothetical protein